MINNHSIKFKQEIVVFPGEEHKLSYSAIQVCANQYCPKNNHLKKHGKVITYKTKTGDVNYSFQSEAVSGKEYIYMYMHKEEKQSGKRDQKSIVEFRYKTALAQSDKGPKLHVSMHHDDVEKSWNIVRKWAVDHGVKCLKIITERSKSHQYTTTQKGKVITIYSFKENRPTKEGPTSWEIIIGDLNQRFLSEGIRPGPKPDSDLPIKGSQFIYWRDDSGILYGSAKMKESYLEKAKKHKQGFAKNNLFKPGKVLNIGLLETPLSEIDVTPKPMTWLEWLCDVDLEVIDALGRDLMSWGKKGRF